MNCGDIPWNLGLNNRPYIWYRRYLQFLSVPVAWPLTKWHMTGSDLGSQAGRGIKLPQLTKKKWSNFDTSISCTTSFFFRETDSLGLLVLLTNGNWKVLALEHESELDWSKLISQPTILMSVQYPTLIRIGFHDIFTYFNYSYSNPKQI